MTHREGPHPLFTTLRQSLVRHGMTHPGQTIGVALSGGPDSTALLALMAEVAPSLDIGLVALHFDHCYRPDSGDDARFAEETARRLGIPFRLGVNDRPKPASGLMAEARRVRYAFFDRMLADGVSDAVALAHTKDDVAESALIRLLRGGGPGAFGGPRPVRGPYLRPLLDVTKAELIAYLAEREIGWRDDPTNRNRSYLRNRVRGVILPALVAEEPTAVESITRLARQVAAQDKVVVAMARRWLDQKGAPLPLFDLQNELLGLRHAIIRRAAHEGGCVAPLSAERVEEIDELLMRGAAGATVELGAGYVARIDQTTLSFVPADRPPLPSPIPFVTRMAAQWGEGALTVGGDAGEAIAQDRVPAGAHFRCRQTGDRVIVPSGSRSLKRYLIDKKVPASTRDRLPLLADGERIFWIPGVYRDPALAPVEGEPTVRLSFKTTG